MKNMHKHLNIKHLLAVLLFLCTLSTVAQRFKFSEFSFANNGGTGNPNDPLAGSTYHGSPDWVELYNTSSTATYTLSGWYLSDDRSNLVKWQIPTAITGVPLTLDSHNVVVIFLCGHDKAISPSAGTNTATVNVDLHANFSCNQTKPGSKVYLSDITGAVKDSIDIFRYKNKPGHSWGRAFKMVSPTWSIPSPWRLYQTATPGQPNPDTTSTNKTAWYYNYCPTPKVDAPGFYSGLPTINIADTSTFNSYIDYSQIEIYATNDCSPPVSTNPNAQLVASSGTQGTGLTGTFGTQPTNQAPVAMVRIMMHENPISSPRRYLDGFEFYGAYLEDSLRTDHSIPVTCVCTDTTKLFTAMTADSLSMMIHHFDKNDKHAFKNWGQGHRSKVDFFNPVGAQRKQWQFVFRSEDEYGYNYTNTSQLFADATLGYSSRKDFPEILFRSAAEENFNFPGVVSPLNGFRPAHIRDFFNHTMGLRHKLRFEQSHYSPTYMIVNGFPRGIYYMKETIDSMYMKENFNYNNSAIIKNSMGAQNVIVSGQVAPTALTRWNWFYSWAMLTNTNVHFPPTYYRLSDSLDFNSLNDYMIYNMLSVNTDFIKRYGMWWKGLPNDTADNRPSKWRFALTNTDFTWGYDVFNSASISNTSPTSEPCDFLSGYGYTWPAYGTNPGNAQFPIVPLWYKLMDNDTFKSEFLARYSDLLNTALSCDSLTDHLKYVRGLLSNGDKAGHVWYNMGDANGTCIGCDSVSYWNDQLDSMKVFITQRCSLVNEGIKNCFQYDGPYNVCVDVTPPNSGYVILNSLELKNFVWNGDYFDSVIMVAQGIPYQNYVFDHWETKYTVNPDKTKDSVTFYVNADACITAVFKLRPPYETSGTPMLPTGFSPNGDGVNDVLNIYGTSEATSYEMEVYNRWGERIFYSIDKTEGWDGKFKGTDVPAGVYAYRYNIFMNGKSFISKGNVTLVR